MTKKRKLHFKKFRDVLQEARSLLETGYRKNGKWSLGQICDHLARSFKAQSGLVSRLPTFMQFGVFTLVGAFAQATRGMQVPTAVPPEKEITDEEGVERLAKAIKRFKKAAKNSGTFGFRNDFPKEARQFHLRHCEHHLAFLTPKNGQHIHSSTTQPEGNTIQGQDA